jgi:glucose/mannose-6-phosphate isomerase
VEGETVIEQVFSLIYLGDMISYYLAILQNVDPTSIDYIDYLKENI